MGRFAQYRKRGRAVESQSFPAPVEGDWELNLVDDVSVITIVNGDPPATHFQGRWRAAGATATAACRCCCRSSAPVSR